MEGRLVGQDLSWRYESVCMEIVELARVNIIHGSASQGL